MSIEKLEERQKQYGIPPIPYLPAGKVVLVYRLPSETRTAGGLFIAETAQEPVSQGVLLSAGLEALDVLKDHLIEIGDVVWFGKFEGWETEVQRDPENRGKQINQFKVDGVLGSVDAIERLQGKTQTHRLAYNEELGEHYYEETTCQKQPQPKNSTNSQTLANQTQGAMSPPEVVSRALSKAKSAKRSANGAQHG